MAECILLKSGGGISSDETTVTKEKVITGSTYLGSDTDDEIGTGTMPDNGAWTGAVEMNRSIIIPSGYHNGVGKVNGPVVAQRGAPTYSLPINGIQNLPEGYYTGGSVTQNIATLGGQAINPASYAQTVGSSGKYMTGNIVINGVSRPPADAIKKGYRYILPSGEYVDGTFEGIPNDTYFLYSNGAFSPLLLGFNATCNEGYNSSQTFSFTGSYIDLFIRNGTDGKGNIILLAQKSVDFTNHNYLNVEFHLVEYRSSYDCNISCNIVEGGGNAGYFYFGERSLGAVLVARYDIKLLTGYKTFQLIDDGYINSGLTSRIRITRIWLSKT